ncbi:hypothetical protein [Shinella sp.]|uniref:hypothetical protein n=1 Tax=Shinella sp. TaxID=1870904 RepID=UPI004035CA44
MRIFGFIVAVSTLAMATQVEAQEFDASGPTGPRISQNEAQAEIDRLKAVIREMEREISRLRENASPVENVPQKGSLIGTWLGGVSCGRRQFSVTLSVGEQFGRVAKGSFAFSGAGTGTDEAQISPMPTEDAPDSYIIVTAKAATYDYVVKIDANTMSGKSTSKNCTIQLERD